MAWALFGKNVYIVCNPPVTCIFLRSKIILYRSSHTLVTYGKELVNALDKDMLRNEISCLFADIWVYNTVLLDAYCTQTSLFCPIAFS